MAGRRAAQEARTAEPVPPESGMTVDELAARAGVTVRTIRFYGTRGLLPPPVIGPRRVGRYDEDHLSRLVLIEELQQQGMTLAAIERYLRRLPADLSAHDLAVHRALVASWMPHGAEETTRAGLEERVGRELSEEELDRLAAMGMLVRGAEPDEFRVDAGMLHLGVQLLDVPISLESILAARSVVLEHTRSAARELSRLFREETRTPDEDGESGPQRRERVKSLSAHMQPLVVQALVTAFQRSMKEELRVWYPDRG